MSTFMSELQNPRTLLNLRAFGFCGVDDSVNAEHLQLLSIHYPWIEWGILCRPDLEGTPRYPTWNWVTKLCKINADTGGMMRLAGHLCSTRCQEVLDGNFAFVKELSAKGFGRVQVNATAANNVKVDRDNLAQIAANLKSCIDSVPEVEWIFQLNDETKAIWEEFCSLCTNSSSGPKSPRSRALSLQMPEGSTSSIPINVSCLYDASCGTGKVIEGDSMSEPLSVGTQDIPCGYAGGISPDNVLEVLTNVAKAASGKSVWIDMESSLRIIVSDKVNTAGKDMFSVEKCVSCILVGITNFPQTLPVSRVSLLSV